MAKSTLSHSSLWVDEEHCEQFEIATKSKRAQKLLARFTYLLEKTNCAQLLKIVECIEKCDA